MWHCSLSLHPDEPALSREQWGEIAREFVAEMGFGGAEETSCRWVAIHHGQGKNGNDHIHVVVQLVDEQGHAASVHLDRPRAQKCARDLERKHGLLVVEGRDRGRGARATNTRQAKRAANEHERAKREGRERIPPAEADRERLERVVRTFAAAAANEGEFVRTLRSTADPETGRSRVLVRPRWETGRDDVVVGYSIALAPEEGRPVVWHSGGKLAKDLTLPRLRQRWPDTPQSAGEAVKEWRAGWLRQPPAKPASSQDANAAWDRALHDLAQLRDELRGLPAGDPGAWAPLAGDGAALFYGWAQLAPEHAPALYACGELLARSAQIPAGQARPVPRMPQVRSVALLAAAMVSPQNRSLSWLVLFHELAALTRAIADLHQAARDARTAEQLRQALEQQLAPVGRQLAEQHAREDPEYAQALEAQRLAAAARPPAGRRGPAAGDTSPQASPGPRPPSQSQKPDQRRRRR